MKRSHLFGLVFLVCAVLGIFLMMSMRSSPPEPTPPVVPMPVQERVLVARSDIPLGATITVNDLRWQDWPKEAIPPGAIVQSMMPGGQNDVAGKRALIVIRQNDVITNDKLVSAEGGLPAVLMPPGTRLIALTIDGAGLRTSGNFIHPRDRVDVVQLSPELGGATQVLLRNILVFAVGPAMDNTPQSATLSSPGRGQTFTATTITLQVTDAESRMLLEASKRKELYFFLRPFNESAEGQNVDDDSTSAQRLMVRFGVVQGS